MRNLSKTPSPHNGILSEETTTAIRAKYVQLNGPCVENVLEAVLQAAEHAAAELTYFQMIMCRELVPDLKAGRVVFRNTQSGVVSLDPLSDLMSRVLREAGL